MIDLTIGWSQAEIESLLESQKKAYKKTLVQFSDNGSTATYRKLADIEKVIRNCQDALQKLDPATYGDKNNRVKGSEVDNFDL